MLFDDGKNIIDITKPSPRRGDVDWLCANSSISPMQRLATIGLTGLPI
jgi:hypothetical protein